MEDIKKETEETAADFEEIKTDDAAACECGACTDDADCECDCACDEEECGNDEVSGKKEKKLKSDSKKHKSRSDKLEKELEAEKAKVAETEDKYLRVLAEYDNFRRRSAEERKAVYADAVADAVKQLLPVIDNLERATEYTDAQKVAEGVKMILDGVADVLEKMNIKTFGETGEAFDPNLHNAVMHVEDEEHGESEIIDVFQKGYMVGDKVIRYAMVRVAN